MKARKFAYWISTGFVALAFASGGIMDLLHAPEVRASLTTLGYPAYLMTILGSWKVLGVVALLAPGFPRLKEWAYAGMFFDLSGAVASHLMSGDLPSHAIPPFMIGLFVIASWALRPADRTLGVLSLPRSRAAERPSQLHAPA